MENVACVTKHEDFTVLKQLFKWAGFRLIHDSVVDAADQIPTKRQRWLALLIAEEVMITPNEWQSWSIAPKPSIQQADILMAEEKMRGVRSFFLPVL